MGEPPALPAHLALSGRAPRQQPAVASPPLSPLVSSLLVRSPAVGSPAVRSPVAADGDQPLLSKRVSAAPLSPLPPPRPQLAPRSPVDSAGAASAGCARVAGVEYAAVFLTPDSREVLLSMLPPRHPVIRADHMTLAFKPNAAELLALPLGAQVALRVIGQSADSRAQVLAVDAPAWLPPATGSSTHVTLSLAPGVAAKEAGALLSDALERTAAGVSAVVLGGAIAPGAYEHLSDPLELTGFVGVELDSGERLFSLEELSARKLLTLTLDQAADYTAAHGAVLCEAVPVPPDMGRAPYPPAKRSHPSPPSSPANSTGAGPPPAAAPAATPPPVSGLHPPPPSARLLGLAGGPARSPAAAKPAAAGTSGALAGFWDAAEAPPAPAPATLAPSPLRGARRPRSGRSSLEEAADQGADGSQSASSSSSGDGPVVYASAVHAGDWALVAPLLEEAAVDNSGLSAVVMREGWVKDVVAHDPYQPKGVLVLLHDNTLGHVQQISDPRVAQLDGLVAGSDPLVGADADAGAAREGGARPPTGGGARVASSSGGGSKVVVKAKKHRAAGGSGGGSAGDLLLMPAATAAAAPGCDKQQLLCALSAGAGAAPGRDDQSLWREFEELQAQHGEALCSAILEGCDNDFEAAIRTIRGQDAVSPAGGSTAAVPDGWASPGSAGASSGMPASPLRSPVASRPRAPAVGAWASTPHSPAPKGWSSPPVASPAPASPPLGRAFPAAAAPLLAPAGSPTTASPLVAAAARRVAREREVAALAEAFGVALPGASELCATLAGVAPQVAIEELVRCKGDVNAAAEALLLSEPSAAAAAAGGPASPARPRLGAGDAALRALGGADPSEVLSLRRLSELLPSVAPEIALAVLRQHGGDDLAAARALTDGVEAEEAAARVVPWATPAGALGAEALQLSEEDQLSILRARGLLRDGGAGAGSGGQRQQQGPAVAPDALPPHLRLLQPPARSHEVPTAEAWGQPDGGRGYGRRSESFQGNRAQVQGQRRREAPTFCDAELARLTQEELKAKTEELRLAANTHFQSSRVLQVAASEAIRRGDEPKFAELLRRHEEEERKGKRIMTEVNRIAYRASNLDKRNVWTVDLHGMSGRAAVEVVSSQLNTLSNLVGSGGLLVQIVTGRGKHSKDGVPIVRAQVMQYLSEMGYRHELDPTNEGMVLVHLSEPSNDSSADGAGPTTSSNTTCY